MTRLPLLAATLLATLSAAPSFAHDTGIHAEPAKAVMASFDIIETTIVTKGEEAVFTTRVRGEAGVDKPDATGKFEGSGFKSQPTYEANGAWWS
jgi:hypothetical protein